MHALTAPIIAWYAATLQTGGYPLIVLLMAIESSLVPLPSEFIIPPAAYLAHSHGPMTPFGVVLAGTFGSWLGASVMYWVSRLAGRPLVMAFATWWTAWLAAHPLWRRFEWLIGLSPDKIERAERWSARFGSMGIFVSRLLPVIRHLIGIPSGVVRLNFLKYSLFTLLGSFLWCCVLSYVGIAAGANQALMAGDLRAVGLVVAGAAFGLGGLYYFFVYRIARADPPAAA